MRRSAALVATCLLTACATSHPLPPLEFAEDVVVSPDDVVTRPTRVV